MTPMAKEEEGMIYIWLKGTLEEARQKLAVLANEVVGLPPEPRVEEDRDTGQPYLSPAGELLDPITTFPVLPDDLVDRVTYRTAIYRGIRTDGLYESENAQLVAVTDGRFEKDSGHGAMQQISILAPSVGAAEDIFRKFRCGDLSPKEDWEAPQITPEEAEAEVD